MLPPKKIIFDVGANDCSNFIQEVKDDATTHLYAFEPTPTLVDNIRNKYFHLKNFHFYPWAIGEVYEEIEFKIAGQADWGCSSFLDFSDKSQTDWEGRDDFKVTQTAKICSRRLDDFIKQERIPKIDYLHVDTQGYDLKVLKGMGRYLSIVKEGVVEAAAKPDILYYGQNSLEETVEFLQNNGFTITSITNNDHLGNEVNIHFRRDNKIKLFIVTYKNSKYLNSCVESIFRNTSPLEQSNLQVFIINNHSSFELNEEYKDKVTVLHNDLRPDFSTGHLSRNWNQAIINGFGDLNNPHCDILITCQDDTVFRNHFISKVIEVHKTYDFFTCGPGDNFMSYTPQAIKRIGLWDERYCGISSQEMDYFIRAFKYHREGSSINDYYHDLVLNPIDVSLNPIEMTETGFERQDENHLASINYHVVSAQVFVLKWPNLTRPIFETIGDLEPQIPSFITYPYFEKDVETLIEQKFLFKFDLDYMRLDEGRHTNKFTGEVL